MFDLKKALSDWKRSLRKLESFEDGTVMELESHLLDEFDKLKASGLADEEAFARAAAAVGRPEAVGGEYFKESRRSLLASPSWQRSRFYSGLPFNYLKVALRTFRRNMGYSLINILGLAIGMACSLLIVLWVLDESTFDTFHKNGKDIYRVIATGKFGNHFSSPAPLAPAVLAGIPEVAAAVRVHDMPRVTFQYEKRVFYEENGITADASLFKIFSFPLLQGDVDSALAAPDAIILSSSMARKYFENEDPVGKTLLAEGQIPLTVAGVMADVPRQSHIHFDYVVPFKFAEVTDLWGMGWGDFNFKTYIQARPQRDEAALAGKLNEVAFAHLGPDFRKQSAFSIQRLSDIYLNPIGPFDIPLGDRIRVFLFSLVALFIVLIAGVNFINLSTARAEKRAKEIGMRKVVGADRRQIIAQFFGESLLITLSSLPLAVLLVGVAMPHFNQLTGKEFAVRALAPGLLWGLAGIACVIAFLAGAFPALYLSSIRPTLVLKNGSFGSGSEGRRSWVKRGALRRILVTSQFAVTITLILATLVVGSQLRLMRQKSWHLDRDQIITIPIKENIGKKYDRVRSELLADRAIVGVAAKDWLPTGYGTRNDTDGVTWEGKAKDQKNILMGTTQVDTDYFATMGMRIIAGRGFSTAFPGDRQAAYVLDEQAVRSAGLEDAVGKSFAVGRRKGTIVGIVKNTVFHSLRQELRPQVFYLFDDLAADDADGTVFIRVKGGSPLPAVIAHIRKVWNRINSYAPFEYHFLDQQIAAQYGSEQRLGKLFATFAILAVFISCLGLFGLVSFVAEQRTKEIGIRKVLGASVPGIVALLTREFAKQVILANVLAWPLAYFLLGKWLQGFVYRIAMGAGLFLFSGVLVLVLALLTSSFQAVKAARMNPTRSLRYE
jgi:putative ABC transport system permease protein